MILAREKIETEERRDDLMSRVNDLIEIIGKLVIFGITDELKDLAADYLYNYDDEDFEFTESVQAIINAKRGQEKQAAREALRMILVDLDFVEVENVQL